MQAKMFPGRAAYQGVLTRGSMEPLLFTPMNLSVLLNLSSQTIESHRANLMQKLGLHRTTDIILYAVRKRIIS